MFYPNVTHVHKFIQFTFELIDEKENFDCHTHQNFNCEKKFFF